ncbi:MAG: FG-GAP-like repeat-containing protein [Candidatus Zixiibacteriota bacterium]
MKQLSIIFLGISILLSINIASAQDSLTLLGEIWGEKEDDCFVSCASAGDVNADGFMDIIAGTHPPSPSQGYVKIYLGGEEFYTIPDLKIVGEGPDPFWHYSGFGWSVACAGDVNSDGYDDVIVGADHAFNYKNGASNAGKAYIYFGGDPMDTTADVILQDSDYNHNFGYAVSSAGDVNNDGYDDVVVGAPWFNGRAFVYFGGEDMDSIYDVYIEGKADAYIVEFLGTSVAGIGDVNSDGYDDILIGAPQMGSWPYAIGRASIYYGGNPMDTIADITFHGDSIEFLYFGRVVASAGDVNGDGLKDVIVGGISQCVSLFHSVSDYPELEFDTLTLVGEDTLPSSFGLSISTSGDLNKDNFDDILIGDCQFGKDKGKVYVFYGNTQMDSLFDVTLVGDEIQGSKFGFRVASAGDINGDGYEEIMVSSFGDSTNQGKVFIYTSKPTSVQEIENESVIQGFTLYQNYPNPFNSTTTIPFTVHRKRKTENRPLQTTLSIYNILGQKVKTMLDEMKSYGNHQAIWDGKDDSGKTVPSGIYFCQLKIGDLTEVRKMIFLK